MTKDILISSFKFTYYKFNEKHTVGSVQLFEHPCIGYINKGSAQFLYRGKNYYAEEGDLIYIAKGTKYYSVWTGIPEIDFYSVDFSFVKPYCYYDYRFQIIKNYPGNLFKNMYGLYNEDYYMSVSYMYRLLSDIYKHMVPEKTDVSGKISVRPAIDYIEKNYNIPISIDTLSELCHSCNSGFFKLFKAETGVTPIAYKHNIMIQNSLDLLVHTDLTIDEISAKTGFSSSNYFRKIFFGITGKTPKEVR